MPLTVGVCNISQAHFSLVKISLMKGLLGKSCKQKYFSDYILREFSSNIMCHVSPVTGHLSPFTCLLSLVTCIFFVHLKKNQTNKI